MSAAELASQARAELAELERTAPGILLDRPHLALSAPLEAVTGWLARHGLTLMGAVTVSKSEAVILADRGPHPVHGPDYPWDRYVTWRAYSRQAEPELGSYFRSYLAASLSLVARAGLAETVADHVTGMATGAGLS